jgi:hypothetical protein
VKSTSRNGISSVKLNASSAAKTVIATTATAEEPQVRAQIAQDAQVELHRGVGLGWINAV